MLFHAIVIPALMIWYLFFNIKANNSEIKNINDPSQNFKKLNLVLLNLAKRVVVDGEGASKFITIKVLNCRKDEDAKK